VERSSEPRTVEEAQDQIARARAELAGATGQKREFAPPPASPPPPPPVAPSTTPASRPADAAAKAQAESGANADTCQSPCRALASMRRAVVALCRLTGDDDARCLDARKTLTESEARVASCTCS
jgi:hypothetical protein